MNACKVFGRLFFFKLFVGLWCADTRDIENYRLITAHFTTPKFTNQMLFNCKIMNLWMNELFRMCLFAARAHLSSFHSLFLMSMKYKCVLSIWFVLIWKWRAFYETPFTANEKQHTQSELFAFLPIHSLTLTKIIEYKMIPDREWIEQEWSKTPHKWINVGDAWSVLCFLLFSDSFIKHNSFLVSECLHIDVKFQFDYYYCCLQALNNTPCTKLIYNFRCWRVWQWFAFASATRH